MFKLAGECVPNIVVNLAFCDKIQYKSCSSHGDRIPWNFLGQTAISGCEGFLSYWELTLSPASGCDGGLVVPKLMTRCPTVCCVYLHSASHGMECNTSGQWEESKGHCTWPGLSIPGCGERFSKSITGYHVRPYMKLYMQFTGTLSTTRYRQPGVSATTFWLLPLTRGVVFHSATGWPVIYKVQSWTPSHQFWCYQTTSTPWRWGQLVPETSVNLHILTWLSAWENFVENMVCLKTG